MKNRKNLYELTFSTGKVINSLEGEESNIESQLTLARDSNRKGLIERLTQYLDQIQEALEYHQEKYRRFTIQE